MSDMIQIDYEQMSTLRNVFVSQAERVRDMGQRLQRGVETLRAGAFVGLGANAFYTEMDNDVLPGLQRLIEALYETSNVLQEICIVFEGAEQEAASSVGDTVHANGVTPETTTVTPSVVGDAPVSQAATYTVVSGDTLWAIAQRHGISLQELIAANPQIANPDLIYPGQQINIPTKGAPLPEVVMPPQMPPVMAGNYPPAGRPGDEYYRLPGVYPQHPMIGGSARPPAVDANGYGNWGQYDVGQLVRMIDDPNAPWMNGSNASPERISQIIRYLNPGGPNDPNAPNSMRYQGPPEGTCNAFAKDAMYLMNAPFPYHAASNAGWANNYSVTMQHDWLKSVAQPLPTNAPPTTGWYRVSSAEAQAFANRGLPSLQINSGHVALVAPEPAGQSRGGNPPYVAEGGAPQTVSNGAYRNRSGYDYFVYVY